MRFGGVVRRTGVGMRRLLAGDERPLRGVTGAVEGFAVLMLPRDAAGVAACWDQSNRTCDWE